MTSKNDPARYDSLSKEELIALLMQSDSQKAEANKKLEAVRKDADKKLEFLRKEVDKRDKKIGRRDEQIKARDRKIAQQEKDISQYRTKAKLYDTLMQAEAEAAKVYKDSLSMVGFDTFNDRLSSIDSMPKRLVAMADALVTILRKYNTVLAYVFDNGGSKTLFPAVKQIENEIVVLLQKPDGTETLQPLPNPNADAGKDAATIKGEAEDKCKHEKKKHADAKEMLTRTAAELVVRTERLAKQENRKFLNNLSADGHKSPITANKQKKPSVGKQKRRDDHLPSLDKNAPTLKQEINDKIAAWSCPNCHAQDLEQILPRATKEVLDCFVSAGALESPNNGVYKAPYVQQRVACKQCGFVDVIEAGALPLMPDRTVSLSPVVFSTVLLGFGMPVNASGKLLMSNGNLGHSTLSTNIIDASWLFSGVKNWGIAAVNDCSVNHVDETKYCIIDKQDGSKINYVCMYATPPDATRQAVIFETPQSRAYARTVAENLYAHNKHPREFVLSSDALASYLSVGKEQGFANQCCLVHLYRMVRESLELISPDYIKAIDGDTDVIPYLTDDLIATNGISGKAAIAVMMFIFTHMQLIFDFEAYAEQKHKDTGIPMAECRREVRTAHCLPLMDKIDAMFNALAKNRIVYGERGGMFKAKGSDPLTKAVFYYMHNREYFRTFLTHFDASCHNNGLERYAKAVATLRNRAIYSRSKEGAQAIALILTAVHTAQANGITNIYEYLYDVARYARRQCIIHRMMLQFKQQQETVPEGPNKRQKWLDVDFLKELTLPPELEPHNYATDKAAAKRLLKQVSAA